MTENSEEEENELFETDVADNELCPVPLDDTVADPIEERKFDEEVNEIKEVDDVIELDDSVVEMKVAVVLEEIVVRLTEPVGKTVKVNVRLVGMIAGGSVVDVRLKGTTVDRFVCGTVVIVVKVVPLRGAVVVLPVKVPANVDVVIVVRFRIVDVGVAATVAFTLLWLVNGVMVVKFGNGIDDGRVGTVGNEESRVVTFNVIGWVGIEITPPVNLDSAEDKIDGMALVMLGIPKDAWRVTDNTDGGCNPGETDAEVGRPSDMLGKTGPTNALVIDAI